MYEEPKEGHIYIGTVDCSEGVGADYSAINIIDVTKTPYKQVAKYRANDLLLFFLNIIYSMGMKYNAFYILLNKQHWSTSC